MNDIELFVSNHQLRELEQRQTDQEGEVNSLQLAPAPGRIIDIYV